MHYKIGLAIAMAMLASAPLQADTVYLKNGVRFDGVVTPMSDKEGLVKVDAGGRVLFYRDSEIKSIEKNSKTGHLDKEALLARWEARNKKLTEETGLTAEQRRQVRGLMFELRTDDASKQIVVREQLKELQSEFDVFGYMSTLYVELSPLLAPNVLEALAFIDGKRSIPILEESAQRNYFEVRARAIEMLRRLRYRDSLPLVVRGLADFSPPVQVSAAYAVAEMGAREATPALISLLTSSDVYVAGAARESLAALWADTLNENSQLNSAEDWETFWNSQSSDKAPILLAQLELLSPEEDELKQTIDSNH